MLTKTETFANEVILPQLSVLYFPEHKLAVEVDQKGHTDRDERKQNEREEK